MLVLEEAVEAGPRKEPMESSKKLLLLPLTLALLVGCILLDNGLLEEKDNIILSAMHIDGIHQSICSVDLLKYGFCKKLLLSSLFFQVSVDLEKK